ncbi:MAG: ROK family protein [Cyclobacteriaceae bacterium]|nr:ROK family protein [Cyclobacteriaceae bacterium]
MALWGLDLGGTKIEGVVLESAENPNVLARLRIPTGAEKGYGHILDQIQLLIGMLSRETGLKPVKIGIGTPGTLDPGTQTIKNSNTTCLNQQPFRDDLEKKLGVPFGMANDANCFALAETRMGSVKQQMPGAKVTFGVIMGSGVGGGVVVNGEVLNGRQGIGGEWGHNFLDVSGGACYCGKTGCVERVISGKNLERYHFETFGVEKKLAEIYQSHLIGTDADASHTIDRLITYFGKAMAVVINILDPDAIILGGGVGNIDLLYTAGVEEIKKHIFNSRLDTVFLKPALGDSAGVFGAAFLGT